MNHSTRWGAKPTRLLAVTVVARSVPLALDSADKESDQGLTLVTRTVELGLPMMG